MTRLLTTRRLVANKMKAWKWRRFLPGVYVEADVILLSNIGDQRSDLYGQRGLANNCEEGPPYSSNRKTQLRHTAQEGPWERDQFAEKLLPNLGRSRTVHP